MDFESKMRHQLVLAMVQRAIFCPYTGDVLDIRTCCWLVDSDGDPAGVMSPKAYDAIVNSPEIVAGLEAKGLSLMGERFQ